jgi:hypothetical protein
MSRTERTHAPEDFAYALYQDADGTLTLFQGDDEMWSSLDDEQFFADFEAEGPMGPDSDATIAWLVRNEYLPPGVEPERWIEADDRWSPDWLDDGEEDDDEEAEEDAAPD